MAKTRRQLQGEQRIANSNASAKAAKREAVDKANARADRRRGTEGR